jgi:hypothetical protein
VVGSQDFQNPELRLEYSLSVVLVSIQLSPTGYHEGTLANCRQHGTQHEEDLSQGHEGMMHLLTDKTGSRREDDALYPVPALWLLQAEPSHLET